MHCSDAMHALPQAPQWASLVRVSTQAPPHALCPAGQSGTHELITHRSRAAQVRPHAPQFMRSVVLSTQFAPHRVWPSGQRTTHIPAVHDSPLAHARSHAPQLARSVLLSTQAPPQNDRPTGHWTLASCASGAEMSDGTSEATTSGGETRSSTVASMGSTPVSFTLMSVRRTSTTSTCSAGVEHATEASANSANAGEARRCDARAVVAVDRSTRVLVHREEGSNLNGIVSSLSLRAVDRRGSKSPPLRRGAPSCDDVGQIFFPVRFVDGRDSP